MEISDFVWAQRLINYLKFRKKGAKQRLIGSWIQMNFRKQWEWDWICSYWIFLRWHWWGLSHWWKLFWWAHRGARKIRWKWRVTLPMLTNSREKMLRRWWATDWYLSSIFIRRVYWSHSRHSKSIIIFQISGQLIRNLFNRGRSNEFLVMYKFHYPNIKISWVLKQEVPNLKMCWNV